MIDEKIALRCFAAISYITLRAYVTLLSLSLFALLSWALTLSHVRVCVWVCAHAP